MFQCREENLFCIGDDAGFRAHILADIFLVGIDLNERLAAFVRRHEAGSDLVDLANTLCPKGPPCPAEVDGLEPRRLDGAHFDAAGSVWLARRMLPQILAAGSRG